MRQVVSISLPEGLAEEVKRLSRSRGFSSISAYIRSLVESDRDLISEEELLESVEQARKEYREGKTVTADSISRLL